MFAWKRKAKEALVVELCEKRLDGVRIRNRLWALPDHDGLDELEWELSAFDRRLWEESVYETLVQISPGEAEWLRTMDIKGIFIHAAYPAWLCDEIGYINEALYRLDMLIRKHLGIPQEVRPYFLNRDLHAPQYLHKTVEGYELSQVPFESEDTEPVGEYC